MRYLIPLAAAAIMLSGCSKKEAATAAPEEEEELPLVETDVVAVREIPLSETYTANIEAENLNNIAPATPNRIRRILVDVGDPRATRTDPGGTRCRKYRPTENSTRPD